MGAALALWLAPDPARACGGLFCNQPPTTTSTPRPVIAQAAENVVFVLGKNANGTGTVEAHVQIVYTGAAAQFSWIVPMSALPSLDVGNDILFQILDARTRPTFNVTYATDGTCKGFGGRSTSVGCGGAFNGATGSGEKGSGTSVDTRPSVDVAFHGNVGPYESSIVRSDDPVALEAWLTSHNYYVSPEASQIIQDYVATGSYFVALRLQMDRDVNEIRPIVLRLAAEEGCLPLKLTAIASENDLRINIWVLGDGRAVPLNYREMTLNLAKLDWVSGGANYDRIVSTAANETGGNAFLTEYAQPASSALPWFTVPTGAAAQLTASTTPAAFWNVVVQQIGLPLSGEVLQVLRQFVPEPQSLVTTGVTETQFYATLPQFWAQSSSSFAPFDAAAAAAAMDKNVLRPMTAMRPLFEGSNTLTRVATFISPEEMTKDPLFVPNPTLPMLSNVHAATARIQCGDEDHNACDAPVRLDITDTGRSVWFSPPSGSCNVVFPPPYLRADLDADAMPAAERGFRRDVDGEGTVEVDNTAQIAAVIGHHNDAATSGGGCAIAGRLARRPWLIVALFVAAAAWRRRRVRAR